MKPEEREELEKVLEYIKLARKSHINLSMMLSGEAGYKNVIEPLERLTGWHQNSKEVRFNRIISVIMASGLVGLAAWKAYKIYKYKEERRKEAGAKE